MRLAEKKESLRTTNTTNPHPILQKPGVLENYFFSTLQEEHLICFIIFFVNKTCFSCTRRYAHPRNHEKGNQIITDNKLD